jgi:hypothetical protein
MGNYLNRILLILSMIGLVFLGSCRNSDPLNKGGNITLSKLDSLQRVDIYIGGILFTSYWYSDTLTKPFLYPVNSASGTVITRGFPLFPRAGERIDHPHHVGIWFNYGNVNNIDFWNNSFAIPADQKSKFGKIIQQKLDTVYINGNQAFLKASDNWLKADSTVLLNEELTYIFSGNDTTRSVTRYTTLTAQDSIVQLKDNKEGLWAIRLDRFLEMPSTEPVVFTDANGIPTAVPALNNVGVSGMYFGSNGLKGDSVWGTRNKWVMLTGKKNEEKITVIIFDHPGNPGFPAHFHARGYGLFSINNLGQKVFRPEEPEQNFILNPGLSLHFKHRMLIFSGVEISVDQAEDLYKQFVEEEK